MEFNLLYQNLMQGAVIIRALTEGISQAEACFKPDAGSWSVLEVICHMQDVEREDFRQRLDSILHRPFETWEAFDPGSWIEGREYNKRNFAEALEAFFAERDRSLAWLKTLTAPNWDSAHTDQFGSITAGEMFAAWVDHDNHHIRQLTELRHGRIASLAEPFDVGYAGEW